MLISLVRHKSHRVAQAHFTTYRTAKSPFSTRTCAEIPTRPLLQQPRVAKAYPLRFSLRTKMSDTEIENPAEILAGLQEKLQSDTETRERALELSQNIEEIRQRMAASRAGAGTHRRGNHEGLLLIAVSKLKPASDILALHASGQVHFGENYVQELSKKAPILPSTVSWHYIGGLQTSAISKLARIKNLFAVHSIDAAKKATALNRLRPDDFPKVRVYVQVNTSGEDSKSGIEPFSDELWETVQVIRKECPKLKLQGLMTIGAIARSQAAKEGEENEDFVTLVKVAEWLEKKIEEEGGEGEKEPLSLSMGMSDDFENAISNGASCVRVGSSIFGARPKKSDAKVL